jgi:hypothetical protein
MKCLLIAVLAGIPIMLALGQGHDMLGNKWPERLSTRGDIKSAKLDVESIDIWNLPIEDYPLLAKFTRVKNVMLDSREGTFATDEKLKALAALDLTNLAGIVMVNCRLVTDEGIRNLARIRCLKGLELEGTAITDEACAVMSAKMNLTGINVANCRGVTLKGIKALATSDTLREFTFSAEKLTQKEVLGLVTSFRNVTWCQIVDPEQKLDAELIKATGQENKMHIVVKRTGALQDKYGTPD